MTDSPLHDDNRMPLRAALEVLAAARADAAVVSTMGSCRDWPVLSDSELDLHYLPSTMGGGAPLALGLALARPERHVIVLSGDGSLLMSLGSLVTIAAAGADNLCLILIDNGVYEVTGGQATPAAEGKVDYCGLARAAGFPMAAAFHDLDRWKNAAATLLTSPGPRLIALRTEKVGHDYVPASLGPIVPRIARFSDALAREDR